MDAEVQTWSHPIYENKAFLNLNHLLHCEAFLSQNFLHIRYTAVLSCVRHVHAAGRCFRNLRLLRFNHFPIFASSVNRNWEKKPIVILKVGMSLTCLLISDLCRYLHMCWMKLVLVDAWLLTWDHGLHSVSFGLWPWGKITLFCSCDSTGRMWRLIEPFWPRSKNTTWMCVKTHLQKLNLANPCCLCLCLYGFTHVEKLTLYIPVLKKPVMFCF